MIEQNEAGHVDSLKSFLGWSLPKRLATIKTSSTSTTKKTPLNFRGVREHFPEIRVFIGMPKYRLANGRTASLQEEYIAKTGCDPEFFSSDLESTEAQFAQHGLLEKLTVSNGKSDLYRYFSNPLCKQNEVIILDSKGFVVNGNRRLCVWRYLYAQNPADYKHFEYIDAVILPEADELAIEALERELQIDTDLREDYSWHAFAFMIKRKMSKEDKTEEEIAKIYGKKKSEIVESIQMLDYAKQYLDLRGKSNMWSEVSNREYAFKQMVSQKKNLTRTGEKALFENIVFWVIDQHTEDRIYKIIPQIKTYLEPITEKLSEIFPPEERVSSGEDLLSDGEVGTFVEANMGRLATILSKQGQRKPQIVQSVMEVIDLQAALTKEMTNATFLNKQVERAKELLASAYTSGTHIPDVQTEGLDSQLEAIEEWVMKIREWVVGHKKRALKG